MHIKINIDIDLIKCTKKYFGTFTPSVLSSVRKILCIDNTRYSFLINSSVCVL